MSVTTLRKRLVAVEVRRLGGVVPPPFFGFSFADGGPGTETGEPKTLEEYRARYRCDPPPFPFTFGFEEAAGADQEARP